MTLRKSMLLSMVAVAGLLGACGGGSGGGGSSPVVTPPPPPPAPEPEPPTGPQMVTNLQTSHTFSGLRSSSSLTVNRTSSEASRGTASAGALTIRYDAAARSYTVTASGHSTVFSPADMGSAANSKLDDYKKESASGSEQLIFLRRALGGTAAPRYVGMGLWQRNTQRPDETDMLLDTFVYGFEAPAAAVPRTGAGSFWVDAIGFTTSAGSEPSTFEGSGYFNVDFGAGVFSTWIPLLETGLLTGATESGTNFELNGTGKLSSTDGGFSGQMIYDGAAGQMSGTMSGRFYGPEADELGAVFSASDGNGGTVSGSMAGGWMTEHMNWNLTLPNLMQPLSGESDSAFITPVEVIGEDVSGANLFMSDGEVDLLPDGTVNVTPGHGFASHGDLTTASIVESADPNFIVYESSQSGQEVRVTLYKTGPENTQLQLTYASFGQWQVATANAGLDDSGHVFFAYGLRTPEYVLAARTGSARYSGIVYGAGSDKGTLTEYAVTGTSHFDVDFSRKSFSGNLVLSGTPGSGGSRVDFGKYDFGGGLDSSTRFAAGLRQGGAEHGRLQAGFYGPNAEEIAGAFTLTVAPGNPGAGTAIAGATVAKQR